MPDINENQIQSKSGFFAPLNAREKGQKPRYAPPYLTINCTMKLLHTLNQQQLELYVLRILYMEDTILDKYVQKLSNLSTM